MTVHREVVIGGPGSGKSTYLAGLMVEQRPSLAIDPTGGLAKAGRRIATVIRLPEKPDTESLHEIVESGRRNGASMIMDLHDMSTPEAREFTNDLGRWLTRNWTGGLIIVDEISWLIDPMARDHGLIEAAGKMRNVGTSIVISAHRPAGVNKSIAGLADRFRVGRLTLPADLEAASKILKSKVSARDLDAQARRFPGLGPGDWLVFHSTAPG